MPPPRSCPPEPFGINHYDEVYNNKSTFIRRDSDDENIVTKYFNHQWSQQEDKYSILLESLTFDRMGARLRNIATNLPGTCKWLFRHKQFAAWADENQVQEHNGFLFIKGKPGSGKSTLMKETVWWAKRIWSKSLILTYFFNARAPNVLEKSSLGLYRSLVYQLVQTLPNIRLLFMNKFSLKERDGKIEGWTETELQNFLLEMVTTQQLPVMNLFIDALDEGNIADVRHMVAFLECLTQRSISASTVTRVCLSSRHYPHISIRKCLSIVIEDQLEHKRDIEVYIQSELARENSPQMDELRQKICDRSVGMFLWVVLVVSVLNKAYDRGKGLNAMLRKLDEIPQDLYFVFSEILFRDADDMDKCLTLIQWVLFSLRPLRPVELYTATQQTNLSKDVDNSTVPAQDTLLRYLLHYSHGFIELTPSEPPDVRIIHETVRDFLTNRNAIGRQFPARSDGQFVIPDFQADSCHMVMAEDCLQYLLHSAQKAALANTSAQHHPLAEYAAEYWWQHAWTSNKACSQRLLALVLQLLTNKTNLLGWVRQYNIEKWWIGYDSLLSIDDLAPPLYYAARIGLLEVVSHLLDQGTNTNTQGGHYGNALSAASYRGHEKIVQILLDKGADVNAQGGYYGNALSTASYSGHEKIVQMLLDNGADFHAQGGYYGHALCAASFSGEETIVQMLLDEGADVNAYGGYYGNALSAASFSGREKTVQMLLDKGADINAQGGHYGHALSSASYSGHKKIVQMLLDKGADVNAHGGYYINALSAASFGGHEQTEQILLNAGADKFNKDVLAIDLKLAATDSGYCSGTKTITQYGDNLINSTQFPPAFHANTTHDAMSTCSKDSVETVHKNDLIHDFAQQLFEDLEIENFDPGQYEKLFLDIEDVLADFSLRFRQGDASVDHQKAAKYIYKYNSDLVKSLKRFVEPCAVYESQVEENNDKRDDEEDDDEDDDNQEDETGERQHRFPGDPISLLGKMEMWEERKPGISEEQDSEAHPETQDNRLEEVLSGFDVFEKFKTMLSSSSTYQWLLATLRNRLVLMNGDDNILKEIKETIFRGLPEPVKIRPGVVISDVQATFEVDWPLRRFVTEQWPSRPLSDGISCGVTLTGDLSESQALTCCAYLDQVWPTTGRDLLQVIEDVLQIGSEQSRLRTDNTQLLASENGSFFNIQVRGTRGAIAEVGQQLCWLAAALRTSSDKEGISRCIPQVRPAMRPGKSRTAFRRDLSNTGFGPPARPQAESPIMQLTAFRISIESVPVLLKGEEQGICWRKLFRSAMLVGGYPILRRPKPDLGLEIPLNIAAGLLGTRYMNHFGTTVFVKGFSAMLAPSDQLDGLIVWHFTSDESHNYLPYPQGAASVTNISSTAVAQKRHIIGWCRSAEHHVGSANCTYDVKWTGTKLVGSNCALNWCFLTPQMGMGGGAYKIGEPQMPTYPKSENLDVILRLLRSRFVCLWDVREQRGWLVDGLAALLHLLRASLKYDEQNTHRIYQLEPGHLQEPVLPHHIDAAEEFICDARNRNAIILSFEQQQRVKTVTLEDRVMHYYHILEKAFNYQQQSIENVKRSPYGLLEGWEFNDLVRRRDLTLKARHTPISSVGKGWVDLLRAAGAVSLFGSGFGELIEPIAASDVLCPKWSALPTKRWLIAASISVIKKVMDTNECDADEHPKQLTRSITWLTPSTAFDCCGCKEGMPASKLVQVAWPVESSAQFGGTNKVLDITASDCAAVIFGHNEAHDWHWEDRASPLSGPPPPTKELGSDVEERSTDPNATVIPDGEDLTSSSQVPSLTTQITSATSPDQSRRSYGDGKVSDQGHQVCGDFYNSGSVHYNYTIIGSTSSDGDLAHEQSHPEPGLLMQKIEEQHRRVSKHLLLDAPGSTSVAVRNKRKMFEEVEEGALKRSRVESDSSAASDANRSLN